MLNKSKLYLYCVVVDMQPNSLTMHHQVLDCLREVKGVALFIDTQVVVVVRNKKVSPQRFFFTSFLRIVVVLFFIRTNGFAVYVAGVLKIFQVARVLPPHHM